jgi:hypothetical protein
MAFGIQSSHVTCPTCDGRWSPMRFPVSPGLGNAGFDALAENLTLKLGKDRQHPSQRPSRRGGEI